MPAKASTTAGPIGYVLTSKVFSSVRIGIPPRILKNIPWIVTTDITLGDMTKRLKEVPLGTLFVIDKESNLVGVITSSGEAAEVKCGGGGGGKPPNPESSAKNCEKDCEAACADRGGCAWVSYDPFGGSTKCVWECVDGAIQKENFKIGEIWF